jgi:hypothetical protein
MPGSWLSRAEVERVSGLMVLLKNNGVLPLSSASALICLRKRKT